MHHDSLALADVARIDDRACKLPFFDRWCMMQYAPINCAIHAIVPNIAKSLNTPAVIRLTADVFRIPPRLLKRAHTHGAQAATAPPLSSVLPGEQ